MVWNQKFTRGRKNRKSTNTENKHHAAKKTTGQKWNQRWNHKIPQGKWKWKHDLSKYIGDSKSSSESDTYSNIGLPQEIRKISNNLTYHLKKLEEESPKSAEAKKKKKVNMRKEIKKKVNMRKEIKLRLKNNRVSQWNKEMACFFKRFLKMINL